MKRLSLFYFFLVITTFSLLIQASSSQGQVYSWTDENGVVHYADTPKNKSAVVVNVKQTTSNSMIESKVKLPEPINNLGNSQTPQTNLDGLSEEDRQYCGYILDQINLAKEAVETGSELKASYAQAYIEASDKLLRDNNCI